MKRGDWLEKTLETCNRQYRLQKMARIDKIATPTSINPKNKTARFTKKSTVDFIGFTREGPVAFDTKETGVTNFPFYNVHKHQADYLKEVSKNYGVESFLLIWFKKYQALYRVDIFDYLAAEKMYRDAGRKSIPYDWFGENARLVKQGRFVYFDYLFMEGKR